MQDEYHFLIESDLITTFKKGKKMHWQDHPYKIAVTAGEKKSFCSCGQTKNPPYCDGSHKGSLIQPHRVVFEEDQTVSICGCGLSKKMPYCDGSHKSCKT